MATIITSPVPMPDELNAVLGTRYNNLSQFCQSEKINQWSKYKPVGKTKMSTLDEKESNNTWKTTATWWKGDAKTEDIPAGTVIGNYTTIAAAKWFIKCGMRIIGFSSPADVLGAFNPVGNSCNQDNIQNSLLRLNYGYVPPVGGAGGAQEWFRLTDFCQYKHDADDRILTDYETSLGVQRVLVKNGDSAPTDVRCELWTYPSDGGSADTLDIDDLFDSLTFAVVCGALNGNNLTLVGVPQEDYGTQTSYYRARKLNLNISQCWDKTIIGIYCIVYNNYYLPVIQTNSIYYPNCPIIVTGYTPRVYKAWRVEQTSNPLPGDLSFGQKQTYGTSVAFSDPAQVRSWTFQTSGLMDRWYLKVNIPRESNAAFTVANTSFRVEFVGMFLNLRGETQYASFILQDNNIMEFVVRNEEPNAMDWRPTQQITVTPGTGTQSVYLAIYNLFAAIHGTWQSGTIWQIKLLVGNPGGGDFTPRYEVTYGSVADTQQRLSVNF